MKREHRMEVTDVMSEQECRAVVDKVFSMIPPNTKAEVKLASSMSAATIFARSETQMATDMGTGIITARLVSDDRRGAADGTGFDDASLKKLVEAADRTSREWRGKPNKPYMREPQKYKEPPKLYFDAGAPLLTPDGRGDFLTGAIDATDAAGLIGAGRINLGRSSHCVANTEGLWAYSKGTGGSVSLTARTKDGTGSGWAWSGYEDWSKVDTKAVIAKAVDIANRSRNPVAVEPGRYTVILEPAAVASIIEWINFDAWMADRGMTTFSKDPIGTNKIGLQMLDRRLNIVSDPWDPEAPRPTHDGDGMPLDRQQWFEAGILKDLMYSFYYAKEKQRAPSMGPENLRLYGDGPTQTLDEMIANTKRGIWVHRLTSVIPMDSKTCLLTGTTRDGTFLIENGKITKAIKNLRFTESPFFIFNKLEAFGTPIRASQKSVAPRMKVRDFDFTSLTDAI